MIALLSPLGLTALAAAAVPLVVHFIRRSDRQRVSFAAMRWLGEQPHPRQELRLHERWLLVLRMLLIAALALWLSLPVWRGQSEPQAPWILVAPGIEAAAARGNVVAAGEWHWLAPGFPTLEAAASTPAARPEAALTSLVREIDSQLIPTTALTLVVPTDLGGLDAERLQLARPVTWQVLPGASPASKGAVASTLTLAARYDAADPTELPLVRALASAWQADGRTLQLDIAPRDKALPALPAWLIWLGATRPSYVNEWVRHGGSLLVSRQPAIAGAVALADDDGRPVLRTQGLGAGRVLSLAGPLKVSDIPALAAPDFPKTLAALLRGPISAPDRAPAAGVSPLQLRNGPRRLDRPQPLAPYLSVLIAVLFLVERLWATRTRTRIAAASPASVGAPT